MSARVTTMRATLRGPRAGENQNLPPFVTYYVTWAITACRDAANKTRRAPVRDCADAPIAAAAVVAAPSGAKFVT